MSEIHISIPAKDVIDNCKDINNIPILDNVPSSSPKSVFVHLSNVNHFNHREFINAGISASSEISSIQSMDEMSKIADDYISKLFSRRSISKALLPLVDRSEQKPDDETEEQRIAREKRQEAVRNASAPYFDELFELLSSTKDFVDVVKHRIIFFFSNTEAWESGKYSSEIVHSFCLLFYRIATLDEIHLVKPSLSNDLTNLLSYKSSGLEQQTQNFIDLKRWVSQENSIEFDLTKSCTDISEERRSKIFHIIMPIIMDYIKKERYVVPENLYAYLRTAIFMTKFFKPDPKLDLNVKEFLQNQAALHPLIPLTIELAQRFDDLIKKTGAFPDFTIKPKAQNFQEIFDEMQNFSTGFLPQLLRAKKNEIELKEFYDLVVKGCKCIGRTKNALREQLVEKLLNPPDYEPISSMYERSLRIGYTADDIDIVLRLIAMWRSIHDLFRENFEDVYRLLTQYINRSVQHFAKDSLERVCIHTRKSHQLILSIIDPVREYVGDWCPGEERGGSQANTKNLKDHPYVPREAPTQPAAIELLRIQVQHIINEGSELMKATKKTFGGVEAPIQEKDVVRINDFIEESQYFQDVIQFDELLIDLGDQSDLYFKEVQLDINNVVCFSIRSSLPFILCEYALGNRQDFTGEKKGSHVHPDLCELIFYPLAIYDDAAMRASTKLKSKMLLDEIKNEAAICLNTLTTLISDFTFETFRSYTTLRFLPESTLKRVKENPAYGSNWNIVPAYKLSTMIIQNQYYLHGKLVDLKSLISNVVDSNMVRAVNDVVSLYVKSGITASIEVSKALDILRETRRSLWENGIVLMPFDAVVCSALGQASPNAFCSKITTAIAQDISHAIAYKSYMRSNPTRLFSTAIPSQSTTPFGKGTISRVLRDALSQTTTMVTIEHLTSLVRILDTGSVAFILSEISKDFEDKFGRFTTLYKEQRPRLQRFRDEPMSTPGTLIYDRFEGAYRFFTLDKQIDQVFKAMKALGNILAVASMLDIALTMKNIPRAQTIGYFRGVDEENLTYSDQIKDIIPDGTRVKEMILGLNDIPTGKEIHPPFLSHLLSLMMSAVEKSQCFDETSTQYLRFETLTGFASAWSVLEFVFNMLETNRKFGGLTPFQQFGEGVMFFAAAMLCVTGQERLHYATNIGRRIERVKDVDFASAGDERLSRFCAVCQLESSSLEWAKSVVSPIVKQMRLSQQYE